MKQDNQITKKMLTDLLKANSLESEKRMKIDLTRVIMKEISGLRKEFREAINDAEKRIKGSLMVEIKELSESIFKLEMKEDKHYNFLVDKLDWLVGAYTKFEEEHDIHSLKISEHTDKLEDYLDRLKNLEGRAAQPA